MNLSKYEKIVERHQQHGVDVYIVTRNNIGKYTLYSCGKHSSYVKIKTSSNPKDFDKIIYEE